MSKKAIITIFQYDHNSKIIYSDEKELSVPNFEYEITKWNDVVGEKYNKTMVNLFINTNEKILKKILNIENIINKTKSFSPVELQYNSNKKEILSMKVRN